MRLDNGPRSRGSVWMELTPDLTIGWRLAGQSFVELGASTLQISRNGLGTRDVNVQVTNSAGSGFIPGTELATGQPISRVVMHWLNMPPIFPVRPLASGTSTWLGRWDCSFGGWTLVLDAMPDLQARFGELRTSRGVALTHVGELRRTDGGQFSSTEAAHVLFGLQMAFSFAVGRWVAPAMPVGFDDVDERVWEQWAPWRCDAFSGFMSWFDTHRADDLRAFVTAFLAHWIDPARSDTVRYVAHHLIAANQSKTTVEARIMLVQAATEFLGWVNLVLTGRVSSADYQNPRKYPASEKLRLLLTAARIPTRLPPGLHDLRSYAASWKLQSDGPRTLTKVRNMLVHPKDPGEPYRHPHLVAEAWQLSMHYGNLLLLRQVGYRGAYQPQLPPRGWAHTSVTVPWSRKRAKSGTSRP